MEEHVFHPNSRLWIYTASRNLTTNDLEVLEKKLELFCSTWTAHSQQLFARGMILMNRFVVLIVDETQAGASGCSIDTSVHFIQKAGKELDCNFLSRNLVAIKPEATWEWVEFKSIPELLSSGRIDASTPMIDTLIETFESLKSWEIPISDSWLKRYLQKTTH